jgi:hypothetical protein
MDYWTCFGDPIYDTDGNDPREENTNYVPLGLPCLIGACAEISDGGLQLCLSMFNSKNLQFLKHVSDDESAGNFQPSSTSKFCESACNFSMEIMFFVLEIVWNSKTLNANFMTVISSHQIVCRILFPDLKFHLILILILGKRYFIVGPAYILFD